MRINARTKHLLKLCFIFFIIAFFGCKDEETPDPRQAFASEFEMDDFDVLVTYGTDDSTFVLTSNPEIEFEIENDLDPDEMRMEIEELLEDIIQGTLGELSSLILTVDLDDDAVIEISDNEFQLDDYEFTLIASDGGTTEQFDCEISLEGELDDDEVTIEFDITLFTGVSNNYVFTGTAVGERK